MDLRLSLIKLYGKLPHRVQQLGQAMRRKIVRYLPERLTIAHKLALILTVLITSGMVLLGLVIINNQTRLLENQMNDFAKTVVNQLTESSKELILSDDSLSLMVLIGSLSANQNTLGVVIYNEGGKVLATSGMTPPHDIISLYHSAKQIGHGDYSIEWHSSNESNEEFDVISFIAPITFQKLIIGHGLVTFSKASLNQAVAETIQAIIAATIFMILLGIITAYFIGQRLSQPIYSLMDASKAIDSGNYDFRIIEKRNDEIGYLIDSFNSMANGLLQKSQVENAFSRFVSNNVAKQIMNISIM